MGGVGGPAVSTAPRKLAGRRRRETVAVLIFSGAPIFESSIPLSVFGVDRQDAGVPRYRLLVCAGEDGPLSTTGGVTLTAPFGLEALARAGTIVVPAWRSISQPPPVEAIAALRKAHHEGARIIGLCTGAFVLAAAGLLDGRPATTHWMYAPTLAKRYPRVHVDPRELFVDDGDVLTSAGTAAGIDLCLHVVRSDHGAEAANALARRLVVPNRRSGGGQAQYIDQSLPEEIGNDPLAEVVTWALENLNQQFDVEVLAARAYMSRRTFDRRFRTLTGSAPLQWLITQRVLQAQRLLETSELSVDDVARRCGFRSPVALRGHFRRQLGVSPAAYRTTYRARRPGPGPAVGVPSQGGSAERAVGLAGGAANPATVGFGGGLNPAGVATGPASAAAAGAVGVGGPTGQSGVGGFGGFGGHGGAAVGGGAAGIPGPTNGSGGSGGGAGQPAPLPAPGKNRIRPLVPPQPGPATRRGPAGPPRPVEHAVAEDGHSQPSARGTGSGHRAERPSPERSGRAEASSRAEASGRSDPSGRPAGAAGLRGLAGRAGLTGGQPNGQPAGGRGVATPGVPPRTPAAGQVPPRDRLLSQEATRDTAARDTAATRESTARDAAEETAQGQRGARPPEAPSAADTPAGA
ncbi:transcriptional regulator GlxA family with amidase domain [Kitasatospora sp. GAS204A]|nr:transcriptional regulator GlxA family with amidase domain [Kitasatospora sp. GAS204B]